MFDQNVAWWSFRPGLVRAVSLYWSLIHNSGQSGPDLLISRMWWCACAQRTHDCALQRGEMVMQREGGGGGGEVKLDQSGSVSLKPSFIHFIKYQIKSKLKYQITQISNVKRSIDPQSDVRNNFSAKIHSWRKPYNRRQQIMTRHLQTNKYK